MNKVVAVLMLILFLLSACSAAVDEPLIEQPSPTDTPQVFPSPTPTERPPVVLTICTTGFPETLFPYSKSASHAGGTSAAKRVLSLLYPQPLDPGDSLFTPRILEKMPSLSDGDLRLDPAPIRRGSTVVDARGELVTATEGVWVRPSGCRDADCAITWNGVDPLEMDQMVIDFQIREGLTWSDGTPVSAGDSAFSFRLASDPDAPLYGWAEVHTLGYSALDVRTIAWVGYPGFASSEPGRFFWVPLPAHLFDPAVDWATAAARELWTTTPPSYGPFVLSEWSDGEIRLVRNPYDSHNGDVQPHVDQVLMKVVDGGAQAAWAALQDGACDVLDTSFRLASELELLSAIESAEEYELRVSSGETWTQLVFGVRPAEYDALNNPIFAQRLDYFGDVRVRQGVAACLDRQAMAVLTTGGWGPPWPSFASPEESYLDEGIVFDLEAGTALLDEAGWIDHDGDPSTPRLAQNVVNVFNGMPLSVTLLASPSAFHQDLAGMIQESLTACGLGVEVQTLPTEELYAPGPGGPLFGRTFDLALIAWQPLPGPDCGLYASWAVPNAGNGWIGTNIAGFRDDGYDRACAAAALALPGEEAVLLIQAEEIFLNTLPAVPLLAPPVVEVWRIGGSE